LQSLSVKNILDEKSSLELRNEVLTMFLSTDDTDVLFEESIAILGRRLDYDRIYIYKYKSSSQTYDLLKQWLKDASSPIPEISKNITFPSNPHNRFINNKTLEIEDLQKYADEEYINYPLSKNIQTIGCVPLFVDDNYFGIIGFECLNKIDNLKKHISIIKSISGLMSKSVSKQKTKLKLLKGEEKYRNLFNNMSAAFTNCEMIYDENKKPIDYRFLEVNNKFAIMTNITSQKWLERTAKELLPDLENDLLTNAAEVLKTGKPAEYENYSIPFEKFFQFFIFKTGADTFAVLSYDITEKRATNKALVESERKYRNLFESMQAGFASHEMIYDKKNNAVDYKYIAVNDKFVEITGIKREDWLKKTVTEIITTFEDYWIKSYANVVSTGKPIKIENYSEYLKKYYSVVAFKTTEKGFATLATDITNLKQMEHQLSEEKESLKITLESIGDGVIATDTNGTITMINKVSEELTGWNKQDAMDKNISEVFDIYSLNTGKREENLISRVLKTGKRADKSRYTLLKTKFGKKEYIVSDTATPIKDSTGNVFGTILVFRDVTELKKRIDEIQYLSMHDALTEIYNRSYFERKLYEYDNSKDYPFSIIMGDANGLKITNDVFGHSEGDRLLKLISKILLDCTDPEDIVARWGGDEFVILLPKAGPKIAEEVCDKITAACLDIERNLSGYSACPSISLGYATRTKRDLNILKVLKSAEDWMYKRKLLESKSTHSTIIASMKKTLFEKSHETEEHAERLSKYCCLLGKELNLSTQDFYVLELFSLLHDIGKVAIDGSILTKAIKLTEEDWKEIRRHPEIGYRIANSAPELSQVAEYILTHHERWDGKGYPQGLKGDAIPIQSRILSIIDAFDAMTHDRPYRKAMSVKDATDELKNNSGTQFDTNIVSIFVKKIVPIYEI